MFDTILVVCRGNICRSPVAAAMLADGLPTHRVASAGLSACVGEGVDLTARQLIEAEGIDVGRHSARQLDSQLLAEADLVLVMSSQQRRDIAKQWPEALGKTLRLGHWLENGCGVDIPDPYRQDPTVFRRVHELIKQAAHTWIDKL
ncbi:low molecular weight phosphotyrosine protein phosphatase [Halomonas campisalis]|uniref:protein-tyrosine-phosphatase n=1 Tax=Billgrantia campisalis TaxID=74661 RepID=A0ABS9P4L5_9GAMM|nr:low molecular weight protein-tyrosine-phosphatase [Halomonas campisalis]MCG6656354.1 low molecular weight phosphotyrosine protein phosphatase [Halomonas campisalis]MDR5861538.1 low molecular weight phosphotyrosine protein phosphatase [Halomonas campisalis]